jgi:hypothetical protein
LKKKIINNKDMSNKRRNPFYLTAFKHSYKPKLKGDMFDIVAVAKQALEKRRRDEKIEEVVNQNAFVKEFATNTN